MKIMHRIAAALIARAQRRQPDFVVSNVYTGTVYLRRWWLLPRNPLCNIYLHQFVTSDDDRALHDHPWASLSISLSGRYVEVTPRHQRQHPGWDYLHGYTIHTVRSAGDVIYRPAKLRHRIEVSSAGAWTLFCTGPVIREWGFYCLTGWVPHALFVDHHDKGRTGAGCAGGHRPRKPFWRVWTGRNA